MGSSAASSSPASKPAAGAGSDSESRSAAGRSSKPAPKPAPKSSHPFKAEIDLSEVDDRGRPGPAWAGRAAEISRSTLIIKSRKLCYPGRNLLVAVHLVDDHPVALFGTVEKSEYDGEGLYRTHLNLQPLPEGDPIRLWINVRQRRAQQ